MRTLLAAVVVTLPAIARGGELMPADRPMPLVIDQLIQAEWKKENVRPAPLADDATIIRRLTLDLVGRIPTPAETRVYVASSDANKKAQLVDRLMDSPGFIRHQAIMFDHMMGAAPGRKSAGLAEYFTLALTDNRPWDQIFRELITPNEADPKQKGSTEFLKARVADLDRLTIDVSVAFFGVNVSCAQCHDHPLVGDWKQDHFYGMKAFFSRTIDNGGFLGEREFGGLKFKPNKGDEKQAAPLFLTGQPIALANFREPTNDEQKREKERLEKAKAAKTPPPAPPVSARARLVEVALKDGNAGFFNKSIVNKLWAGFMGYGLVNPLDQMHSENPPSHPDLLEWLARDTATHGYDLRRLIRGLVLSDAYARSSKYDGDAPRAQTFAVARLKPLMPTQFAAALKLATADPVAFESLKSDELEKKIEQLEASAKSQASAFATPGDDFQIGVNEALLFSNNSKVLELLTESPGSLLHRVASMKDPNAAIDMIVRNTLSRPPTEQEKTVFLEYIRKRGDRPSEAYRQIAWALIASAEFRFNY